MEQGKLGALYRSHKVEGMRNCAALTEAIKRGSRAVQDFLTSSFLLTSKDRFYTRAEVGQLACFMGDGLDAVDLPQPALLKPLELWTGKQIFSVLVRPNSSTRCAPEHAPCCLLSTVRRVASACPACSRIRECICDFWACTANVRTACKRV
jgi:hypothetical protein